jgi:hypothetical protein
MNNRELYRCNALRNAAYNDLCRGVQSGDEKLIDSAVNRISVCARTPDQVGFTLDDLRGHHERVSGKLDRLTPVLNHKIELLRKYNLKVGGNNGAGNSDASFRKSLNYDIHEIGKDVRILTRLELILADQLCRRGDVIAMREERHQKVTVAVR